MSSKYILIIRVRKTHHNILNLPKTVSLLTCITFPEFPKRQYFCSAIAEGMVFPLSLKMNAIFLTPYRIQNFYINPYLIQVGENILTLITVPYGYVNIDPGVHGSWNQRDWDWTKEPTSPLPTLWYHTHAFNSSKPYFRICVVGMMTSRIVVRVN